MKEVKSAVGARRRAWGTEPTDEAFIGMHRKILNLFNAKHCFISLDQQIPAAVTTRYGYKGGDSRVG